MPSRAFLKRARVRLRARVCCDDIKRVWLSLCNGILGFQSKIGLLGKKKISFDDHFLRRARAV